MRLRKPSPALVIACVALFVSLGGVGYAAATGSIDSREIRNNTIRGKDVRNNGLSGRDIANACARASAGSRCGLGAPAATWTCS